MSLQGFGTWSESAFYDDRSSFSCPCGAVYPRHFARRVASTNGKPIFCEACKVVDHPTRIVHRDVACRYVIRFGGRTFSEQTGIDTCVVYLRSELGVIVGRVSMFDKFPKPVDESIFDDMPF